MTHSVTIAQEPLCMVEMVFPNTTNHYGTLFGGKVLDLMDRAAFLAATRFTHQMIVTASMEHIDFLVPVRTGHLIELLAQVVYTGTTSLTVKVDLFSEDAFGNNRQHASQGYFHMVAVDTNGRPSAIPCVKIETEQQQQEWEYVERLRALRKGHPVRPPLTA